MLTRRETKIELVNERETAEGKSPKGIKNNVYLFFHFFSIFIEMNMSKWLPLLFHKIQNAILFAFAFADAYTYTQRKHLRMHFFMAVWVHVSMMRISFTSPINRDLMLNNMALFFKLVLPPPPSPSFCNHCNASFVSCGNNSCG